MAIDKTTYRIFLIYLRRLPIILAFIAFIHLCLSYFDINAIWLSFIGGISLLPCILMWLASHALGYCEVHRIPLYYCAVDTLIGAYDQQIGFPLNDNQMYIIYFAIASIFLFIYLIAKKINNGLNF